MRRYDPGRKAREEHVKSVKTVVTKCGECHSTLGRREVILKNG